MSSIRFCVLLQSLNESLGASAPTIIRVLILEVAFIFMVQVRNEAFLHRGAKGFLHFLY
jgi:hypothetical protein